MVGYRNKELKEGYGGWGFSPNCCPTLEAQDNQKVHGVPGCQKASSTGIGLSKPLNPPVNYGNYSAKLC